jgi:hypothetical protein
MTAAKPEQDLEGLRANVKELINNRPYYVCKRGDDHTDLHTQLGPVDGFYSRREDRLNEEYLESELVRLVQAEVAAAQELFWLRGYEAGHAVGSGNLKGEPWAVVRQRLLKERPGLAKLVDPPQQPPTEGGSDGVK